MGCNCIDNCQRCTNIVDGLEDEIERLRNGINELLVYAVDGEEVNIIISNLLKPEWERRN